ncbi:MAG: electron transfer flavoprotein subunit beta/FixA family protein [Armatimonadota bacterium]|nr:electron transfer flavoprotein subunit beta/FixA family protein [Armatimonadota bacterium]
MDVVVCLKQVVDPELPARDFAIDPRSRRQAREGRTLVISTYDEHALEVALRLKEQTGGKVTTLAVGPQAALGEAVRKALAMGADEALVVDEPRAPEWLGAEVAPVLAAAIRRIGPVDLVLAGCESADWVERVVAPLLAEALGAACVTFASRVEPADGGVLVRRMADDGVHHVAARLPAVVSVASDDANKPRLPKVKDIVAARRKPVTVVATADLEVDPAWRLPAPEVRGVTVPPRTGTCEMLGGEPAEQVEALVRRLRDLKLL